MIYFCPKAANEHFLLYLITDKINYFDLWLNLAVLYYELIKIMFIVSTLYTVYLTRFFLPPKSKSTMCVQRLIFYLLEFEFIRLEAYLRDHLWGPGWVFCKPPPAQGQLGLQGKRDSVVLAREPFKKGCLQKCLLIMLKYSFKAHWKLITSDRLRNIKRQTKSLILWVQKKWI